MEVEGGVNERANDHILARFDSIELENSCTVLLSSVSNSDVRSSAQTGTDRLRCCANRCARNERMEVCRRKLGRDDVRIGHPDSARCGRAMSTS
jgi:hypothetical protein